MNLEKFFLQLEKTSLGKWLPLFRSHTAAHFNGPHKESLQRWEKIINKMPEVKGANIDLSSSTISVFADEDIDSKVKGEIEKSFKKFNPWRKGPFNIFGIFVDSEWCSHMKWDRLKDAISPLEGRLVLDVGSSNGYYCFRAAGAGAKLVLGIDHKLTFFGQNQALLKYIDIDNAAVLPMSIDDMPDDCDVFDTIFSMGVIYHVHAPEKHLKKIKSLLRSGGEIVLETLVIEGKDGDILVPEGRYACMGNVRNIPSCDTVINWIEQSGFKNVRLIDTTRTTAKEQHVTDWGIRKSLEHFLDKQDPFRTVEGYPAPLRSIFIAEK